MKTDTTTAAQDTTQAAGDTGATDTTKAGAPDTTTGTTPKAGEGADGAQAGAAATRVVPDKYTLTLPADSPFAEDDLVGFASEAKALGLTQDEAQKLVDTRVSHVANAAKTYLDELKADPELGGAKFQATVDLAVKGRDILFPPGTEEAAMINDWFERTGLGNHKLLVRAFARLGQRMAEDTTTQPGGASGTGKKERTVAEVLYGDGDGSKA
jgi:hypothetical protein